MALFLGRPVDCLLLWWDKRMNEGVSEFPFDQQLLRLSRMDGYPNEWDVASGHREGACKREAVQSCPVAISL